MLGVGQRMPLQEILRAFRNIGNHFEKHDGFIEVIQIVRGKPGPGIDIGGLELCRARRIDAGGSLRCCLGSRGRRGVVLIGLSVSNGG